MGEMQGWLDRLRRPIPGRCADTNLLGVPATRRLKNYAALSGYVYEYCFEGYRDVRAGREFVFSVSGDRKSWFVLLVLLAGDAIKQWEYDHRCSLGDRERYAIAKLALFSAFDERTNPKEMGRPVQVTPELAGALLEKLDL